MPCAVCGKSPTEGAHVRDKNTFGYGVDNRRWNIIDLCPICHQDKFDKGLIGISTDKRYFIIYQKETGDIEKIPSKYDIRHIKNEYIIWKNDRCVREIKLKMGLVLGYEHYSIL